LTYGILLLIATRRPHCADDALLPPRLAQQLPLFSIKTPQAPYNFRHRSHHCQIALLLDSAHNAWVGTCWETERKSFSTTTISSTFVPKERIDSGHLQGKLFFFRFTHVHIIEIPLESLYFGLLDTLFTDVHLLESIPRPLLLNHNHHHVLWYDLNNGDESHLVQRVIHSLCLPSTAAHT
jgi:hypothetical protein